MLRCVCVCAWLLQVPVTFIYGEHDWMNPAAGVAVAEILDRIRERKVGPCQSHKNSLNPVLLRTSVAPQDTLWLVWLV
jgi:hypothetical protein